MIQSSSGGQKVLDEVARAWSSRLDDFEAACRSGSGSNGGPPPVEGLVHDLAHLFEELARKELEAIRNQYFAPKIEPNRTADFTPQPPGVGTPDGKPDRTVDYTPPIDGSGATGQFDSGAAESCRFLVEPGFEYSPDRATTLGDSHSTAKATRKLPSIPGYDITGILGHGGMGVVYMARQAGLNRDVALKMILKGEHASSSAVVRFLTEARAIAQLNHPNIVQVFEINEHDGLPYFSLEYCPGGSLDRALKKEPQPPQRAAELAETIARGLAVAHRAGVLHRDIKPANVLLDANGTPKITDFGLARLASDESGLTATASVLGSPSYMPPEQASGTMDRVGPASDQYSLGASLYEFITGRPPFQGTTQIETLKQVRENEPVPPSRLQPTCPKDLETICLKAISKEIDKRYPNVEAFADDLKAFREGRPISARPVGRSERAWRWAKRNPKVAALSGGLFGLAATLLIGATVAAVVFREKNSQLSTALGEVTAQKKQSDENYAFARENGTVLLSEVPRLLQKQVLNRGAETDFAKIVERISTGTGGVRALPDRMLLYSKLARGNSLLADGDDAAAEKEYRSALVLAKTLAETESVEKDKAQGIVALGVESLAKLERFRYYGLARDRNTEANTAMEKSRELYSEVEALLRARLAKPLSDELPDEERRQSLATCLWQKALLIHPDPELGGRGVPSNQDRIREAKAILEEAESLQWTVAAAEPTEGTRHRAVPLLGDIQYQLYRANRSLRRMDDARKYLEAAIASGERAVKDEATPMGQLSLARRLRQLGDWHVMNGDRNAAAPGDQKAYELMRNVIIIPEVRSILNELSSDHYRVGADLAQSSPAVSLKHFRTSLNLRELLETYGEPKPGILLKVMVSAGRCGQTARAAAMAESILALPNADRDPSFQRQVALAYGVCAGAVGTGDEAALTKVERERLRKVYTEKSLGLLSNTAKLLRSAKAPPAAFEQLRETLLRDPDLDGVRASPEFQKLAAELAPPK